MERTFCIIKPDAVARNLQGEILAMIQGAGLRVVDHGKDLTLQVTGNGIG